MLYARTPQQGNGQVEAGHHRAQTVPQTVHMHMQTGQLYCNVTVLYCTVLFCTVQYRLTSMP